MQDSDKKRVVDTTTRTNLVLAEVRRALEAARLDHLLTASTAVEVSNISPLGTWGELSHAGVSVVAALGWALRHYWDNKHRIRLIGPVLAPLSDAGMQVILVNRRLEIGPRPVSSFGAGFSGMLPPSVPRYRSVLGANKLDFDATYS